MIPSDAILVLGMHRSGTSATAGCLRLLGVEFGGRLMHADEKNTLGYWEQSDVVAAHDVLLERLGMSWDCAGALPEGWLETSAAEVCRKQLREILSQHFGNSPLWSVKDPRMCRLLSLWLKLLKDMGVRTHLLLVVRDPRECAASLHQRNGFPVEKSLALWNVHYADVLNAAEGHPVSILDYDALLGQPGPALRRALETLSLPFKDQTDENWLRLANFIKPSLRHNASASSTEQDNAASFPLYHLLKQNKLAEARHLARNRDGFAAYAGILEREAHAHERKREEAILTSARLGNALVLKLRPPNKNNDGTESEAINRLIIPHVWQTLEIDLLHPAELKENNLRLDPIQSPGIVFIAWVAVKNAATGDIYWRWDSRKKWDAFKVRGTACRLPCEDALAIFSSGECPQVFFPAITGLPNLASQRLCLEISLRVEPNLDVLRTEWKLGDVIERPGILASPSSNAQPAGQNLPVAPGATGKINRLLRDTFALTKTGRKKATARNLIKPTFDEAYYLRNNPDVATAKINPLSHYLEKGWKLGSNPNAAFDVKFYLATNPDVAALGVEPYGHYLEHGIYEGRKPLPGRVTAESSTKMAENGGSQVLNLAPH